MDRTLALLHLIKACGEIEGRKKLQKMVHILKEAGHPFTFRYGFHIHGPFSEELRWQVDQLAREQLIKEEPGRTASGDHPQFSFSITPSGVELLREFGDRTAPAWERLAFELNRHSAKELEAISTVVYLERAEGPRSDMAARFAELKPHLVNLYEKSAAFARAVRAAPRS